MDNFKVTEQDCLYPAMGKTHEENMFSGGCIFVDHAAGYIHIEHLINVTTNETSLWGKLYKLFNLTMVSSPLMGSSTIAE